jgi:hypothetical protein
LQFISGFALIKPNIGIKFYQLSLVTLGSLIFFLLTKNPSVLLIGFDEADATAMVEVDSMTGSV